MPHIQYFLQQKVRPKLNATVEQTRLSLTGKVADSYCTSSYSSHSLPKQDYHCHLSVFCCIKQGHRKRGGRGGLGRPTFRAICLFFPVWPLNFELAYFCTVASSGGGSQLPVPVSQPIRSPRKSDPGPIRYASESNPVLAKSIRGATKSTIDFQE